MQFTQYYFKVLNSIFISYFVNCVLTYILQNSIIHGMINFEQAPQTSPGTHNTETEQRVNQLWDRMITPPEATGVVRPNGFDDSTVDESRDEYATMVRANVLKNIKEVDERSAHTIALHEKMLRERIADFEDVQIGSDDARDRVYEGILATEKRHQKLRPTDFDYLDAKRLQEALREYRDLLHDNEAENISDLSEASAQRQHESVVLADAVTLGIDPNGEADRLLSSRYRIG
jgi:hypothetical protein